MSAVVSPVGRFELGDQVIRQDDTATFDFYLQHEGREVLLPWELKVGPRPNAGTWIMLDVSPN